MLGLGFKVYGLWGEAANLNPVCDVRGSSIWGPCIRSIWLAVTTSRA